MRSALCVLVTLAAAAPAASEERLVVTGTTEFALGSIDVGPHDGFSPGGHFDIGASFKRVRVQGEADIGLWSGENKADDESINGSYRRLGWALRVYWMDLDVRHHGATKKSLLRMYVEAGMGHQWISAEKSSVVDGKLHTEPYLDIGRHDMVFGFGMAQEAALGRAILGGQFGIRVHVAEAPAPNTPFVACRGSCDAPAYRKHDVALFFTMGFRFGR
jgi:hypothetical protein